MENTNENKQSEKGATLKAEFLVPRREGFERLHIAIVRATVKTTEMQQEKPFLAALKRGATAWVSNTPEGREAWAQACEDFNVGDMGNECGVDSSLHGYLDAEGITDLDIDIVGDGCRNWSFDTVLAEPESPDFADDEETGDDVRR